MATMSDEPNLTSAADVMSEAIEFNIKTGRMLYPDGSLFVDAEKTDLAAVLARAADDGQTVVLCYQDGTRRIVEARTAPSAA
jgi:hypothetical protein